MIAKSNKLESIERRQILKLCLANVTLRNLLKTIENVASALSIKQLEWPLHDAIFSSCSIEEFKIACNQSLSDLQIFLIKTPDVIESDEEKAEIIKKFHDDKLFGGHPGHRKMYANIRDRYFWKGMTKDIAKFIEKCEVCKTSKILKRTKEEMIVTPTPQKPFDLVIIDTVEPVTQNDGSKLSIVTIICDLTKYLVCAPVPDKPAKNVARAIFENFILIYGPMKEIRSDRGTEYVNSVMEELCSLMNITHNRSTAHHHETVGSIERNHKELNKYIRMYLENSS